MLKSKSINNKYRFFLTIHRISTALKLILSKFNIKHDLLRAYLIALGDIKEPIDMIIPACMPFESVLAALKYIESNKVKAKLVPYLFDQFAENKTLHRFKVIMELKKSNHLRLEELMLANSYSLLMMKQLKDHFCDKFPQYKSKYYFVEHPLLKKYHNTTNKKSNIVNIIYAGSFYKDIRDPSYFLSVLDISLNKVKANLNIYSFGNCDDIVARYCN